MGTRSLTIVLDGNQELCRIYRQYDGYPEGHGVDLAKLCDVNLVNGFSPSPKAQANGMGDLAAMIVCGLKQANKTDARPNGIGNIYLEPTGGELNDWCEYIYIVRGQEGAKPTIECTTQTGPWPFNVQTSQGHIFSGTAKQWLKKFSKRKAA